MRILLVNDYATPTGGAELQMLALRDSLRCLGHEVRLFASSAQATPGDNFADYTCFGSTSRFRTLLQTANPWAYWKLRHILREFKPEVVHVRIFLTQLSPLILPLLQNIPSLYHVVWYRAICPLGTKMLPDGTLCQVPAGLVCYRNHCLPLHDWVPLMFQMWLWRRWRNAFSLIVANSEAGKRRLLAEGITGVEVVHNGVTKRDPRAPLSTPPTVAFAGRLVREKGVEMILRAFATLTGRVPEARLLLAGDGPEREHVQRMIIDLGLANNVVLLGHLARQELELHFDQAWLQVVPSRWQEPFANVALEAMMRGTAVVASDIGSLPEIVRNQQTGLLVPPGDVDAFARAFLLLLRDRDLAERMGKAGREVALAHFSQETYAVRILSLYTQLCEAKNDASLKGRRVQG